MRRLALPVLLLAAALAGCDLLRADRGGLRLTTDRAAYAAGDTLTLRLANGTSGTVGYNLCFAILERRTDGVWVGVSDGRVCTAELRGLRSGERAQDRRLLSDAVAAGTYRFRTDAETDGSSRKRTVETAPFAVAP